MGYNPAIYKLRSRTENKERLIRGVPYRNISYADMMEIARITPSIITCAHLADKEELYLRAVEELTIQYHAGMFVGGDGELSRGDKCTELVQYLAYGGMIVVTIRPALRDWCLEMFGLKSYFIPTPYVTVYDGHIFNEGDREYHAVSFTTLHRDKHVELSFVANTYLPDEKCIDIWGNFVGNPYWFWNGLPDYIKETFDLDTKAAPHYHGPLPTDNLTDTCTSISSNAEFALNLMYRKMTDGESMDGGNLEHVSMESLDGGAVLIVHRNWLHRRDDELIENINCLAVEDAQELVDILMLYDRADFMDTARAGRDLLQGHSPAVVVPMYIDYLSMLRESLYG